MTMQRYVVVRGFALGGTDLSLYPGQEVLFDGRAIVEIDGEQCKVPKFRGTIAMGWVVPGDQFDSGDVAASTAPRAPMKMRSSEGGNPMDYRPEQRRDVRHSEVEGEDSQVRSVSGHAQATKNWNNGRQAGRVANMPISVDGQDAQEVQGSGFKTRAKNRNNLEYGAGEALREANSVKITPGRGMSREEMLERMDPEQREEYLSQVEALRSNHVDMPEPPQKVNRVRTARHTESEGISLTTTTGGGIETVDLGGTGQTGRVEVVEIEGIKVTNTNGPRQVKPAAKAAPPKLVPTQKALVANQDVRRRVAKSICPDFPDLYDFDATERKKIARIQADFDDRPDVIQAIYAAEGDGMKALLVETFAEAFA